jgi:predicted MFS family arabinose efflux permease
MIEGIITVLDRMSQTTTNLIGLLITGVYQERYDSKKTYIGGMVLMTMTIFVAVFAQHIQMYLAAEALVAPPWGMFRKLPNTQSMSLMRQKHCRPRSVRSTFVVSSALLSIWLGEPASFFL